MSRKLVLVLLALCIGPQPSAAHDIYSHLVDSEGASCCNEIDCAPAPFQVTPIGIQMLVHGRWIAVPNNKIQYRLLPGDMGVTSGSCRPYGRRLPSCYRRAPSLGVRAGACTNGDNGREGGHAHKCCNVHRCLLRLGVQAINAKGGPKCMGRGNPSPA